MNMQHAAAGVVHCSFGRQYYLARQVPSHQQEVTVAQLLYATITIVLLNVYYGQQHRRKKMGKSRPQPQPQLRSRPRKVVVVPLRLVAKFSAVISLVPLFIHYKVSRNLDSHLNNLHLSHRPPSPLADNPPSPPADNCKRAALILFGVPKQFSFVWKSYMQNIIMRNPRIQYEVHMHMYSDLHQNPFSNSRNNEHNATIESPDEIRATLDKGDIPVMLNTSSQTMFEKSSLSWLQESDISFFHHSYSFLTLQNMFRQGNSLREAFQYQQKHSIHSNDDIVYIFARSDTFLMSPVDIPCSGLGNHTEMIVPRWSSELGYNDRFAVAGQDAAKVYASKIEGYKKARNFA